MLKRFYEISRTLVSNSNILCIFICMCWLFQNVWAVIFLDSVGYKILCYCVLDIFIYVETKYDLNKFSNFSSHRCWSMPVGWENSGSSGFWDSHMSIKSGKRRIFKQKELRKSFGASKYRKNNEKDRITNWCT